MTKADTIFKENIERILKDGVFSEQARPKYKDGTVANSKYCLLYTSPSPRDMRRSRMPSSA